MKRKFFFIFLSILGSLFFSNDLQIEKQENLCENQCVLLRFKYNKGDYSRILSTVNESVILNGKLNHKAQIINRISSNITDILEDKSGVFEAVFMTSENSFLQGGKNYIWGEEYFSKFSRDEKGRYSIDEQYFMPTVRNVPVFPDYPVKPGDKWISDGHEAHDLRLSFNIEKPFIVPFNAEYTYLKDLIDEKTGKKLILIGVNYNLYFESPESFENENSPSCTMGHSNQKIWWDNEKGVIDHYSEDFRIVIETFYGDTIIFKGSAKAEVQEVKRSNTQENLQKISDFINNNGLKDVNIKSNEKGVTICIENIQFLSDSSSLMESEKQKLTKIAELLKQFNNDLLITGHCADRGTVKNQMRISEERAREVSNFLQNLDVRSPSCIFIQGKGASDPVASNLTEEGRAKNRRVEITIMDK